MANVYDVMLLFLVMFLLSSLVVTAAGLLGVSVNDALEAYGQFFFQHVADQVRAEATL